MHHSSEPLDPKMKEQFEKLFQENADDGAGIADRERALRAAVRDAEKLGPTGKHPGGLITSSDEGELKLAVARSGDRVVLDFGSPVVWIGFGGQQAIEIGRLLTRYGREACKAAGQPAVIEIG